ncbi:MAG: polysaccharide biosynthesis protein, partial [Alphaproteobacteria bacterium]
MNAKFNIIANVLGKVWASVMNFAFVPIYIRYLGIEAYGLIGFFVSILAAFFVLDMGLSTAINRELARLSVRNDAAPLAQNLMRTLEIVYWAAGCFIGLFIVIMAPWLATHWLKASLPVAETTQAIRLMGLVALFRWPSPLYSGALMGLKRQVSLNVVNGLMATVQGGGAALVLIAISPTIEAFFIWQSLAAGLQITFLAGLVWRHLAGSGHRPSFQGDALRSVFGFSAGITGITLLSVILTQSDKFLLSRIIPLQNFGYYSLASSIAGTLNIGAMAIYSAMFPAFSQLVALDDPTALKRLYHKSAQLLSVLVFPTGLCLSFFSFDLLRAYVSDPAIATNTRTLLSLLAIGNMILSIMLMPLALQLAYGWTKLSLYKNLVAVSIFIPLLWFMAHRYGPAGAAWVWIILTLGYFVFEAPIMHTRLLKGEQWHWYGKDVAVVAVLSALVL